MSATATTAAEPTADRTPRPHLIGGCGTGWAPLGSRTGMDSAGTPRPAAIALRLSSSGPSSGLPAPPMARTASTTLGNRSAGSLAIIRRIPRSMNAGQSARCFDTGSGGWLTCPIITWVPVPWNGNRPVRR